MSVGFRWPSPGQLFDEVGQSSIYHKQKKFEKSDRWETDRQKLCFNSTTKNVIKF